MNITASEVPYYLNTLLLAIKNIAGVDILLFPPFTSLPKVSDSLAGSQSVRLGAQNMSPHPKGAFTGEISASMLRDLFVHYILIGHSERRHLFGETNTMIHDKIVAAHLHQIRPILCIGETLEERNAGKEKQVLEEQLRVALKDLSDNDIENTIIAYEPVWAIGTGRTASVEQAQELVHAGRKYQFTRTPLQSAAFFAVNSMAGLIHIKLNSDHPAFQNLVAILEDELGDTLPVEELANRLTRAREGLKLLLCSWARLEDEALVEEERERLEDIRTDWSKVAKQFLRNPGR